MGARRARQTSSHAARRPGRPKTEVDLALVERLGGIGCTVTEIAEVVGVGARTLERRLSEDGEVLAALEKGRALMRISIRRSQLKLALAGNVTMLIWLGKQLLGQSDRPQPEAQARVIPPLVIVCEEGSPEDLATRPEVISVT